MSKLSQVRHLIAQTINNEAIVNHSGFMSASDLASTLNLYNFWNIEFVSKLINQVRHHTDTRAYLINLFCSIKANVFIDDTKDALLKGVTSVLGSALSLGEDYDQEFTIFTGLQLAQRDQNAQKIQRKVTESPEIFSLFIMRWMISEVFEVRNVLQNVKRPK